ncbi:MAG TPA: elongation factor EF-2 [Candidatus Thermoplasmatota archaeon]|jgi:elongation factor 2|nr:elongation factor EF-2 [Candidatus Thermoplasmatota archaeon]
MGRKEDNIAKARELMHKLPQIRNIGTAAHIDHGKTTFSDNLIAGAGMMSEELAGKQLVLDFDEQEAARGITINAAAASMVHTFDGKDYLINLIDTPGHVDFGGDVTRAMRALDGAFILVCAVEGIMPQTETVIRQAIKERVRPILVINKVDRLINELKVTPEQMQQRFMRTITDVNTLISKQAPDEFKEKWKVNVEAGTVLFASAYNNWAISVPFMKKSGITFKDIYQYCADGKQKDLAKKAPLHTVVLGASIMHHPSPNVAQQYRIPHIWHGDKESATGKALIHCDEKGPVSFMVTKIIVDPHAGEVAVGRMFSGSVIRGMELHIAGMPNTNRVQSVGLMVGADRIATDAVTAGNIAAVVGLKDAIAGATVTSDPDMEPFEKIVHYTDPVVTVKVEPKHTKDLPKLVETLRMVAKADPSIEVEINQETGEHLMKGMGELHLEITQYRIKNDYKVDVNVGEPIVVYRECVSGKSPGAFEGKSPNKHNKFYVTAEPLDELTIKAIKEGVIPEGRTKNVKELAIKLAADWGWDKDEAKGIMATAGLNILVDITKGIQNLHETKELIIEAFKEAMNRGPLAGEPVMGVKLYLHDAKLHEDAVHRGPAQSIPAMRNAIYGAMCIAGRTLLEPKQRVYLSVPQDVMGAAAREVQQRRAVIETMDQEGDLTIIHAKAPVAAMFGFASAIRGACQGRVLWSAEHAGYEVLPKELVTQVVGQIRKRKGLPETPYGPEYYAG